MRSHAKAPSAGSKSSRGADRRLPLRARALAGPLVGLVMALCVLPGSAAAVEMRSVTESFGPDGTSATSFESPGALALDQGSKRLYVLERGEQKIHGFQVPTPGTHTPLGGNFPVAAPGAVELDDIAADDSSHNLYYASVGENELFGFDEDGSALSGFPVGGHNFPCGTAIDSSGNVWVAEGNEGKIQKYSPGGALLDTLTIGGEPCDLALDTAENLYVGYYFAETRKFSASSGYTSSTIVDSEFTSAMTVNRSTGEVYVIHYNYIDVWDSDGAFLYRLQGEGFGGEFAGIAIDEASDELYVADYGNHKVQVYGPPLALPKATTEPADGIAGSEATLHGKVNPREQPLTDCYFEYGTTASYGLTAPCVPAAGSIPADSSEHAVSADVSGLTSATEYHFRLVVVNALGEVKGSDRILTSAPGQPVVSAQSVEAVSFSDAIVTAKINPRGGQTTYHVEYGPTAAYGNSTPDSAPIGFPTDNSDRTVSVHLAGLTPATAYHFRFVASSPGGSATGTDTTFATNSMPPSFGACPNDSFRSGISARLPDCRAYEQATPTDKHGSDAQGTLNYVQTSGAGDRVTYFTNGGLPTTGGSSGLAPVMASRDAGGWSTDGLLALTEPGFGSRVIGWSDDLSAALITAPAAPGSGDAAIFLRDSASAVFQPGPVGNGNKLREPYLAGFASDSSHLIFESEASLLPGVSAANVKLYDLDHGNLTLIGRIPSGSTTTCDDESGPACVTPAGSSYAGAYNWSGTFCFYDGGASCLFYTQSQNAISRDGSRVFFSTGSTPQIYVREGGTATTKVSASQRTIPDPNGEKPAAFMAATPDGSKVFFTSCEKLTDDSTAVSTAANSCTTSSQGQDLYSYDVDTGELTDLTVDANVSNPKGAAVQGVLGASEDGSHVYFAANGVLAPGASAGNCAPNSGGDCNIYLSHNGVVTFVARVGGVEDELNWTPLYRSTHATANTSRVSADGDVLLFSSLKNLTGYDNSSGCANSGTAPCEELFRYSAPDEELICVSCNPTKIRPKSAAVLVTRGENRMAAFDGMQSAFLTRNLSADGDRIFFDTKDALVSTDINGLKDVYEWEAEGSGSCDTPGGCIYLISSGTSPDPSYFGDASRDGDNVLFFTAQQLVPGDRDQLIDVYDAAVEGGLASQHPLAAPTCSSTACQANPPPPPEQTPASAGFIGAGNVHEKPSARRCPKGKRKVRRAGKVRCQKASKQHKRHSNRGGSK